MTEINLNCSRGLLMIFVLFLFGNSIAHAQAIDNSKAKGMYVAAGVKFGYSMIKSISQASDVKIEKLDRPYTEQRAAIESLLSSYQRRKAAMFGTANGLSAASQFALDGTVATLAVSGIGVVPAMAVKAVGQIAVDEINDMLVSDADKAVKGFLAANKDKLLNIGGLSLEELQLLPFEEIKQRVNEGTSLFRDIETMVPGDEDIRKLSIDLLVDGIKNIQLASLDAIDANANAIIDVSEAFVKYGQHTSQLLQQHGESIVEMGNAISDLSNSVGELDKRLRAQEDNQLFIADFVLTSMTPGQKVRALEGGFLKERFACPESNSDCDRAKLKVALIKRYKAEEKILKISKKIASTAEALGDIQTIANNLGIEIKGLDEIVTAGTVASNAFTAAMSGNYFGAIAAITGVFGKKSDTEQKRFEILMSFLRQEFAKVNIKLDKILENQEMLMKGINNLSKQLFEVFTALDERISLVEWEVNRLSRVVRQNAWSNWEGCFTLLDYVESKPDFEYDRTGDFNSYTDILNVIRIKPNAVKDCLKTVESRPAAILSEGLLGNLLDAQSALKATPEILPEKELNGKFHTRNSLEVFIKEIHAPTANTLFASSNQKVSTPSEIFFLLANPASSFQELDNQISDLNIDELCIYQEFHSSGLRAICKNGRVYDDASLAIIQTPMVFDEALKVSELMLIASRIADFNDPSGEGVVNATDLLDILETDDLVSPGRQIVVDALLVMDTAIAGYSMLFGGLTAQSVVNVLTSKPLKNSEAEVERIALVNSVVDLLNSNTLLKNNVATLLLRNAWEVQSLEKGHAGLKPTKGLYVDALEYSKSISGDITWAPSFLEQLFGSRLRFTKANRTIMVDLFGIINANDGDIQPKKVLSEMPLPEVLEKGVIIYPPKMSRLISKREALLDRLLDYDALRDLSKEEREIVSSLLVRSSN